MQSFAKWHGCMDDKTLAKVITIALKSFFYSSEIVSIVNKNNSYVDS